MLPLPELVLSSELSAGTGVESAPAVGDGASVATGAADGGTPPGTNTVVASLITLSGVGTLFAAKPVMASMLTS